ncbi:MAG: class I SAM-dependent methyltransferase [Vicinamibacterales bacterium]|jgi:SAM-dependent methyltransferase|nr:16S rRNA (cytosine(1402)-N(4))-methyltransferase [Acidobacteriota bacterium]MDP7294630.1 class I SAM-dependent methyltransferase [Vicinamibacterales bacterium]MDP7471993.1 class I SAM-dependent methyltransferase [Vicinamibacterales bacterium]MDP7672377.1 class I SAM-dependent methyltransferase [Vicinamibacterales bacterium]HJO39397.1 class I SAM-dependent methyltransferase [Vicinamibacterales bacterium]|tara:strand:- start:929 stop:1639 length:711 start_codon:yes stop_codon:yes gene_type:complete
MSVAAHLRIRVAEYDRTIRTFIPHYSEMLRVAGDALRPRRRAPTIVDLGIGTGALAAACLRAVPDGRLVGLDTDTAMLGVAARRLNRLARHPVDLRPRSFTRGPLPPADLFTACISLHHVLTPARKIRLYRRCHAALRRGGALVSVDCMPPAEPGLRALSTEAWIRHMARSYSRRTARGHLTAWAAEDRYFPLEQELEMMQTAGFRVEVIWRHGAFAVVRAAKPRDGEETPRRARV